MGSQGAPTPAARCLQEPLQNATTGENGAAANPFASLFESQPGAQAGQVAPAQATTEATAPGGGPAGTAPNTAPLPNPWAPNSGSGATAAGGGGATGALPPGTSLAELSWML